MAQGYRAKTATYASVPITDLTNLSCKQGGQSYDLMGDADANVLAVYVDSIATDITVSGNDVAIHTNASMEVGDTGSLVIVYEARAAGRGATSGSNKTLTITATLTGKSADAGTNGIGSATWTFRAAGVGTWA